MYSTLEFEATVVSTHEEIVKKDDEIVQLQGLLAKVIEERDQFRVKCEQLVLENHLLLQQHEQICMHSLQHPECPVSSYTTSIHEDVDTDDSNNNAIVVVPPDYKDTLPRPIQPAPTPTLQPSHDTIDEISIKKPLPERGKFLQAVMEAGPLLHTLLLAGPLPQWQHPPPQLSSGDIPPVKISTKIMHHDPNYMLTTIGGALINSKKRIMMNNIEGQECSSLPNPKHQKVCLSTIIDPNPTPS